MLTFVLTAAPPSAVSASAPVPFFSSFPQCAKSYLSVVPGKFLLFDNMKDAERSTYMYTFIAEMEEGGSIGERAA